MKGQSAGNASQLLLFFGLLFSLIGLYGALRTAYNLVAFSKYPIEGAIPSNLLITTGASYGFQSEVDCTIPPPYYDFNGEPREPTEEEKMSQKQFQDSCFQRISEERERVKRSDISQSAFMLFLGLGLYYSRRKFK